MAGPREATLRRLAERLSRRLRRDGARLVTAESCTGGWIGKLLTDLPGSSDFYDRGYVCYSNAAKRSDLRVPAGLLKDHGAVSEPVARAMAKGALAVPGCTHALAVTGVAGPDGGTAAKPVGTVWIAWGRRRGSRVQVRTRRYEFAGDRDTVRRRSVAEALTGLLKP